MGYDTVNKDSEWGSSVDKVEDNDKKTCTFVCNNENVSRKDLVIKKSQQYSEGHNRQVNNTGNQQERYNKSQTYTDQDMILNETCKSRNLGKIVNDDNDDDTFYEGEGNTSDGDSVDNDALASLYSVKEAGYDSNSNKEENTEHVEPNMERKVSFGNTDYAPVESSTVDLPGETVPKSPSQLSDTSGTINALSILRSAESIRSLGSSVDDLDLESVHAHEEEALYTSKQRCRKVCLTDRLSIDQCDLMNKSVLIRVDYDVPMKGGIVSNTKKIDATVFTIEQALRKGAKSVILMSHLGRPEGRIEKSLSLKPVADELEKLLMRPVMFLEDCVGPAVEDLCADSPHGSVILLENLRFHVEEEGHGLSKSGKKVVATVTQIEQFRASLTSLGEVYVNDAFSVAHTTHSSVVGCAMKQRACGLLMRRELEQFTTLMCSPGTPFLAIICGAKVSDKFMVIQNLLGHVTEMFIGGDMAFTFLKSVHNMEIGDSPLDQKCLHLVPRIMGHARRNGVTIHLPVDFVVADRCAENAYVKRCTRCQGIPSGMVGVDVGDKTTQLLAQVISQANTIVWNGTPGHFELDDFSHGTRAVTDAIVQATDRGATTILVGGDTATCTLKFGAQDKVTHLSTSGGAGLEFLEGKILPGIFFLSRAPRLMGELNKLRIKQCLFRGRRVVIRVDFDIPIKKGVIMNNSKIVSTIPMIEYVINNDAKSVVLISHMGHPNGKTIHKYSLKPVADELEYLLDRKVIFVNDCVGLKVENICGKWRHGSVILLENLRFHMEEQGFSCCPDGNKILADTEAIRVFRESLTKLGDIFINDDFESAHKSYSSVVGIDMRLKAGGTSMMKELDIFERALGNPRRPYLAILGGSNMINMIALMNNFLDLADDMIIDGDLAITFMEMLQGVSICKSACARIGDVLLPIIAQKALINRVKIHLPQDFRIEKPINRDMDSETTEYIHHSGGMAGLDIGQKTLTIYAELIGRAKTIVWCGPKTAPDNGTFSEGTQAMLDAVTQATANGALSIIQCADKATFKILKGNHKISHVCMECGAGAELLKGHSLPGAAVLDFNPDRVGQLPLDSILRKEKTKFSGDAYCNREASNKWIPPYNKKLPPLTTYNKPKPRIKYTGAPPPGMSIPSPHFHRKRPCSQSPHRQSPRKCSPIYPFDDGVPCRKILPPLFPTTKPRVPIQLETLAMMDSQTNLTVHINGDGKEIPEEADIQVTVLQGYVPYQRPVNLKHRVVSGRRSPYHQMTARTLLKSKFKNKIKLATLQGSYHQFGLDDVSTNRQSSRLTKSMLQKPIIQCRKLFQKY